MIGRVFYFIRIRNCSKNNYVVKIRNVKRNKIKQWFYKCKKLSIATRKRNLKRKNYRRRYKKNNCYNHKQT